MVKANRNKTTTQNSNKTDVHSKATTNYQNVFFFVFLFILFFLLNCPNLPSDIRTEVGELWEPKGVPLKSPAVMILLLLIQPKIME